MPNVILTAEKKCQYAHPPFRLMHLEPVDRAIYRNVAQPREDILVECPAMRRHTKDFRRLPNTVDPPRGVVQGLFNAFPKTAIAFEKVIEYQFEVVFGVGREFNRERHARGVCV